MRPHHRSAAFVALLSLLGASGACSSDEDAAPDDAPLPRTEGGMVDDEAGAKSNPDSSSGPGADGGPGKDGGASDAGKDTSAIQKREAEMLTTFWENDTTVFQYAFSRNNNDGYGYT